MKEKIRQMSSDYAGRQTTTVTLEMPVEFLEHVKELATLEGTEYQTIIIYYIHQGLINSKGEIKRLQFAENAKRILEKHGTHQSVIDEISNMFLH